MRNSYSEDELAILRRFGAHVRRRRKERSLSLEELAELAGLNRNYLGEVERGERNIALLNLHRLAHRLAITTTALMDIPQEAVPRKKPSGPSMG